MLKINFLYSEKFPSSLRSLSFLFTSGSCGISVLIFHLAFGGLVFSKTSIKALTVVAMLLNVFNVLFLVFAMFHLTQSTTAASCSWLLSSASRRGRQGASPYRPSVCQHWSWVMSDFKSNIYLLTLKKFARTSTYTIPNGRPMFTTKLSQPFPRLLRNLI